MFDADVAVQINFACLQAVVISLAFIGLGSRLCYRKGKFLYSQFGWPLYGLLGLSIGIFCAAVNVSFLHFDFRIHNCIVVGFGVMLFVGYARNAWTLPSLSIAKATVVGVVLTVWAILFLKALIFPLFDIFDDPLFYLHQIRTVLDRADMIAPFAMRRLNSLGGQSLAQSYFVTFQPVEFAPIFETGFINVFILGFFYAYAVKTLGEYRGREGMVLVALAMVFLLTEQHRENISAQSSSAFYILAVIVLAGGYLQNELKWAHSELKRLPLILSLLLATLTTLKGINPPFVFCYIGALAGTLIFRRHCKSVLVSGAIYIGFLAPFLLASYWSSGSALYPLWRGHAIDIGVFRGGGNLESNALFFLNLGMKANVFLTPLLAALICGSRPRSVGVLVASGAALVFYFTVGWGVLGVEMTSGLRHMATLFIPTNLYLAFELYKLRRDGRVKKWRALMAAFVFSGAYATTVFERAGVQRDLLMREHQDMASIIKLQEKKASALIELQELVPQGEPIVVFVSAPYLLDQKRNPIYSLDQVGEAAPLQPFANRKGFDFKSYFKNLGYAYFLFEDPAAADEPYSAQRWKPPSRFVERLSPSTSSFERQDLLSREQIFKRRREPLMRLFDHLEVSLLNADFQSQSGNYYLQKTF